MLNNTTATRSEILAIIETYEGMIKQPGGWRQDLLAAWTEWKARLAAMEAR